MSDGREVTLRELGQPEPIERNGHLVSTGPAWVEFELTDGGAPIPGGALVGLQTSQTIYLGRVESGDIPGNNQRLRVRVDHWLALQNISSIQQLWSQEPVD